MPRRYVPASTPTARSLLLLILLIGVACADSAGPTEEPDEGLDPDLELVWPLAGTDEADADSVHAPYGPRWIDRYDFHAGIDLPAPVGTPVRAALPGVVAQVRVWDGSSTGAGNAVLVHHDQGRSTSYLHLDESRVSAGDRVQAGEVIGTVGRTGATYPHLHFGYMVDLPGNSVDERRSRSPLELLPHTPPSSLEAVEFLDTTGVRLLLPLQSMTVRTITLQGAEGSATLDYYEIVARGFEPRKEQVQDGVRLDAGRATGGRFPLELRLEPATFGVERVVVVDIHADTIADVRRGAD